VSLVRLRRVGQSFRKLDLADHGIETWHICERPNSQKWKMEEERPAIEPRECNTVRTEESYTVHRCLKPSRKIRAPVVASRKQRGKNEQLRQEKESMQNKLLIRAAGRHRREAQKKRPWQNQRVFSRNATKEESGKQAADEEAEERKNRRKMLTTRWPLRSSLATMEARRPSM
jgi:hypothetical protein